MTVYLEAIRDGMSATVPELREILPGNTLFVPEGSCVLSNRSAHFVSKGFSTCSAIIMKSTWANLQGLFHVYPGEDLSPENEHLHELRESQAILVAGSASTPKKRILETLKSTYAIRIVSVRSVDTLRPGKGTRLEQEYPFHVVYRPDTNEIVVARISHGDVLTLGGF